VPAAVAIGGLIAATAYALIRWPKWGFLGVWFFLILAPTSSVMPLADLAFEHRMYLPLAAVATGVVVGGWVAGQWFVRRGTIPLPASRVMGGLLAMFASIALGILTFQRNVDYRSELAIWEDTVRKALGNERAHNGLGIVLAGCQRADEAIVHYRKALELNPDYADAHYNLGIALENSGRVDEAVAHYQKSLAIRPDYAEPHNNLGNALASRGQIDEAIAQFQKALEIKPNYAEAHNNLGNALASRKQFNEAIAHFQKALEIKPDYAEAHNNLGLVLADCGRFDEAIAHCRRALESKPNFAEGCNNLGVAFARRGEDDEAIAYFQKALELKPNYPDARNNLSFALSRREESIKALVERRESLRSHPNDVALLNDTAWVLATNPNVSLRNGAEAVELAGRAVQLSGGREPAVFGTLAAAYAEAGRFSEAVKTAEQALELAASQNNAALADALRTRIKLYQAGSPYRDTRQPSIPKSN
jgi:protein O-mannosyl-transferase